MVSVGIEVNYSSLANLEPKFGDDLQTLELQYQTRIQNILVFVPENAHQLKEFQRIASVTFFHLCG